jgi:hypothetical protein
MIERKNSWFSAVYGIVGYQVIRGLINIGDSPM